MAALLRPSSRLLPRPALSRRPPRLGPLRRLSTPAESPTEAASRFGSTALLVALGFGAFAGSYLLWPDESRAAPTKTRALLSPSHFTPVTVAATELCQDPNTRLITLAIPPNSIPSTDGSAFGPIWSIYVKDDDIQVERAFTPLEGIDAEGRIKLWVKKYDKGEVGRWLHSKRPGNQIEIRGPLKTWPWEEGEWDEVVMISGGTGITPFFQLLHKELLSRPSKSPRPKTRFTLLHSSRTPNELPPPEITRPLMAYSQAHPERLKLSFHVDAREGPSHSTVSSSELHVGRIGRGDVGKAMGSASNSWWSSFFGGPGKGPVGTGKKVMFLVCGPDRMVAAIAGPYGRNFSQGEVGGVLGELGYGKDSVWKL
ncbi:ferredoxin reductase-like protein [Epithele typhae]|uniref:ferredoxin reductase-like protein n=1 Tax=Epithele typhae TaxID=378194 RepID=UPI002007DD14|nr:ferredoxin reductase-like protein [Epithele typhae]KAH9918237.1 ferredoxin reductase-like protein [Epithele typhae]